MTVAAVLFVVVVVLVVVVGWKCFLHTAAVYDGLVAATVVVWWLCLWWSSVLLSSLSFLVHCVCINKLDMGVIKMLYILIW